MMEDYKKLQDVPCSWKRRIAAAGYTQRILAQKSGVSLTTINKAIKGKLSPTLTTFDKVEKVLRELENN